MRRTDSCLSTNADPAIRRSGDPAIRRSGDPADYIGNHDFPCQPPISDPVHGSRNRSPRPSYQTHDRPSGPRQKTPDAGPPQRARTIRLNRLVPISRAEGKPGLRTPARRGQPPAAWGSPRHRRRCGGLAGSALVGRRRGSYDSAIERCVAGFQRSAQSARNACANVRTVGIAAGAPPVCVSSNIARAACRASSTVSASSAPSVLLTTEQLQRRCTIHVLRPFGRARSPSPGAALSHSTASRVRSQRRRRERLPS